MAYDPQNNPLDAISSEQKKRRAKNAAATEDANTFKSGPNARLAGTQGNQIANAVAPGTERISVTPGRFNVSQSRPYGLTQGDNQKILADIMASEAQAGRLIQQAKPVAPVATQTPAVPRPPANAGMSMEDQRLLNRLNDGGLPNSVYAGNKNMIDQLKQGTLPSEFKNMLGQAAQYNYTQSNAKPPMQQGYKPEQPASLESYPNIPAMLRSPANVPMQQGYRPEQSASLESYPNIPTMLRGPSNAPMQQGYRPEQSAGIGYQLPNIPTMLRSPSNAPMQPGYQQASLMTGTSPNIPQYLRNLETQTSQAAQAANAQSSAQQPQQAINRMAAEVPQANQAMSALAQAQQTQQTTNQQPSSAPQAAATIATQSTQPTLSPQQQAQDKARMLRQQISDIQQQMLRERHRRGLQYTDMPKVFAADADKPEGQKDSQTQAMNRIDALRQELAGYERAGQSVQQAQTPEQYAERAQQFASSAATEIGNQIQKEITAASYLPEGSPQRQAANARIQKMQEYARQQQSVGEALPFNIPGPQPEGAKPVEYSQAVAATQRQQAMAEENMRRRAMDLTEAQKTTAKRELGEQREKDVVAAEQQAKIANINAPERERQQKEKLIEAQIGEIGARTKNTTEEIDLKRRAAALAESQANYAKDPQNPQNIKAMAEAKIAEMEVDRRKAVMAGAPGLKTTEEIQRELANQVAQLDESGISGPNGFESQALAATTALASEIGGPDGRAYIGSMFTGDAKGGFEAVNKINSYAQQLEVLAKVNPKLAQQKARMFLNITPQQMSGRARSFASTMSESALGIGGVVAAPFTLGLSLLGTAAAAAQEGSQQLNASQKDQVVNNFNNARQTLERLASGQQ